jgi:hypothetical protein
MRSLLHSKIDRRMMLQAMAGATAVGAGVELAGSGRDRAAGSPPEGARRRFEACKENKANRETEILRNVFLKVLSGEGSPQGNR